MHLISFANPNPVQSYRRSNLKSRVFAGVWLLFSSSGLLNPMHMGYLQSDNILLARKSSQLFIATGPVSKFLLEPKLQPQTSGLKGKIPSFKFSFFWKYAVYKAAPLRPHRSETIMVCSYFDSASSCEENEGSMNKIGSEMKELNQGQDVPK